MLTSYLAAVRNLLQIPQAPTSLYTDANLTTYINTARGQVAGEGECIRVLGTISTVIGQRNYDFSDIDLGVVATNGVAGAIHVRQISYNIAAGQKVITGRPWEWFFQYHLNNVVPQNAAPATWSQFGQGAATPAAGSSATGSFYIDPPPDIVYTLNCDCVCFPAALEDDTTVEAIPYLWTDAVPFFAAYYALLSSQTAARQADATRMMEMYNQFRDRARTMSNPSVNRPMYQQAADPAQINKIGLPKAGGR